MSKLLKKDLLREDNSYQISQMKASIDSLIAAYGSTQHTREITPSLPFIPSHGVTAGANNCYYFIGHVVFGVTGKTSGYCRTHFQLPSDYVAGTDIIFKIAWFSVTSANVEDYDIDFYIQRDGNVDSLEQNSNATWTGGVGAWVNNIETITITGTNFIAGDILYIRLKIEDDNNAEITYITTPSIKIQVNTRT